MCILFAFIFTFVLVDSTKFLVNLTSVATFAILYNLRRDILELRKRKEDTI